MVRFALLFVGAVVLAASNEEVTMERVQRKLDRLKARSGSMSSSSKHQLNDVLKRIMQIKDEATPEPQEPTADFEQMSEALRGVEALLTSLSRKGG